MALGALRLALASAIEDSVAIPAAFESNVGYGTGPDYTELTKLLRELSRYVERFAASPDDAGAAPEEDTAGEEAAGSGEERPRAGGGRGGVNGCLAGGGDLAFGCHTAA